MTTPDLEERARRGLRSAADAVPPRADDDTGQPPVARHLETSRTAAHRRSVRRSLLTGAGAVAAALVVAVTVRQSDGPGDESLNTQIITATEEAIATSVVHVLQDNTTIGDSEMWTDETTGLARSLSFDDGGAPSYDTGPVTAPLPDSEPDAQLGRTVDHCLGAYTEGESASPPVAGSATRWIQNALADGTMVEEGTEVVDGRELIRLHQVVEAYGEREERVLLVDPDTHRPVRVVYPGTDNEYVQTYEYLERTPENLAVLSPPVPDGFDLVDSLPGDAQRLAAGCS